MTVEDGVHVVRFPSFRAPQSRLLPRMCESFEFGRQVCGYMEQHLPDVDVVYANTHPLLSQALIARDCARRGIPLVMHIQDIYPESLAGKLPRSLRGKALAPLMAMDRWSARQADRVVVISDNMRRVYIESRGLAREKVITVQNWIDEQRFSRLPDRAEACARYAVPGNRFTFIYVGNIGPVAGVEFLIEAFHAARLPQAQLIIAGDGSAKAACVELARRSGVADVQFVSDPDVANVPLLQSLGDVCLLPLRNGAALSSIPSKLMAYLLSAKPVLATLDAESDTARCVLEARCGWVGTPELVPWLASKMSEVAILPASELVAMGQRGRAYGLEHFSKAIGVGRLADIIRLAARRAGPGSAVR